MSSNPIHQPFIPVIISSKVAIKDNKSFSSSENISTIVLLELISFHKRPKLEAMKFPQDQSIDNLHRFHQSIRWDIVTQPVRTLFLFKSIWTRSQWCQKSAFLTHQKVDPIGLTPLERTMETSGIPLFLDLVLCL